MSCKLIKTIVIAFLLNILPVTEASANSELSLIAKDSIAGQSIDAISALLSMGELSIKKGQPYDAANDPALHTIREDWEGPSPQHGYFAVPLIVIGLAGILLFLSRND